MSTEERIAELETLVVQLREQLDALVARNSELEAQLAQAKRDSRTSSKPPSNDGLGRHPAASRLTPRLPRTLSRLPRGWPRRQSPDGWRASSGLRGRIAQSPTRNLLERVLLLQDQVLALLDALTIPFDSNRVERDLRSLKVQQKV